MSRGRHLDGFVSRDLPRALHEREMTLGRHRLAAAREESREVRGSASRYLIRARAGRLRRTR